VITSSGKVIKDSGNSIYIPEAQPDLAPLVEAVEKPQPEPEMVAQAMEAMEEEPNPHQPA
jgi:hypothetical protein